MDATLKVTRTTPSGGDVVATKLDDLNNRYLQLVASLRGVLMDYSARNPNDRMILVSKTFLLWSSYSSLELAVSYNISSTVTDVTN